MKHQSWLEYTSEISVFYRVIKLLGKFMLKRFINVPVPLLPCVCASCQQWITRG